MMTFILQKPASAPAAPVTNAPPASTTKGKSPRKRVDEEDDFVLVDSDDEPTTKTNSQRKRLKNAKVEKEAATAAPAAAATATPTKKAPEVVDLADTPKEKLKKVAASPVKAKTPVKEEKPLLKPLKAASPPPSANKKAVANPFEFFGAPMPVEEEPKETLKAKKEAVTHVKKEATEEIREVKSTPVKKRALPSSITSSGVKNESPVKKIAVESAESSPVPKSAPASTGMYFDNMRIGVTGVTRIMPREEMENYILENGGKLATSISGKTSMLVIGDVLEDGRAVTEGSKYRTAKEKKVKIVTEEEFLQMYDPATRPTLAAPPVVAAVPSTSSSAAKKSFGGSSVSQGQSGSSTTSSTKYSGPELNALWVDKYKPQSPSDLIGHGEMVRKFGDWLKGWHAIHIAKTVKPSFNKNENTSAKAVLLSGPPGIGKTSLAMTMATMFGYDILELNASDTRNKREIEDKLTEAVSTKAINAGSFMSSSSSNNNAAATKHRLVIMDEVDGMGGSDRGGVAELIKVIKLSKVPIVCICNDRQSQKIKSLANYCYDLRVKRPTKTQIAARLVSIAKAEGVTLEQNAAEMLVEQSGNDIRQALNALQMWSYGKAAPNKAGGAVTTGTSQVSYMSYSDVKAGIHRIEKDKVLRQSPFDACGMLLSGYHKVPSFDDRYNSFFIDYSLVPLLIQQNYVDASKSGVFRNPQLDDLKKLEMLSQASDAVSDVDMVGSLIRGQDQHWGKSCCHLLCLSMVDLI